MKKLIITRAGRTDLLEPEQGGQPNRWRMRQPVDAPADTRTITQILAIIANLRADQFIADSKKDAAKFGLEKPLLDVEWETDRSHRLRVGAQLPRAPSYYAAMDDQPFVFTLKAETLKPFEAEFRAAGVTIVEALTPREWKMNEFVVNDPDGNQLVFGEGI